MKKRIFLVMAVLCLILVLVTGVGMAWFYYGFYVNTAQENIRDSARFWPRA